MNEKRPYLNDHMLDLAYRYPFSNEARELVSGLNAGFEERFLHEGGLRVENALSNGIGFVRVNLSGLKYAYLMSYIYARMLISAVNNRGALLKYIGSEARRSVEALRSDSLENFLRIAEEVNSGLRYEDDHFIIHFGRFLAYSARAKDLALTKQALERGFVYMEKEGASRFLGEIIKGEIGKNLPIAIRSLPKEVVDYSRKLKMPAQKPEQIKGVTRYEWIERLLSTPIADVRHRTVNLILAPYLVNVRNLSEESASEMIINYIEKCKEINPDTKINSTYIRYQCRYAKNRGLRPLSIEKAKGLLGGALNFEGVEGVY